MTAQVQGFFPEIGPPAAPPENNQHWGTPPLFLREVERLLGAEIGIDLAANETNHVAPLWFGPGSPCGHEDTLARDCLWDAWKAPHLLRWLNPEFRDVGPYAEKCARYRDKITIPMLTHVGVDTRWFEDHVFGKALVLFLRPRIAFVGGGSGTAMQPLMLSVYGPRIVPRVDLWRWRA